MHLFKKRNDLGSQLVRISLRKVLIYISNSSFQRTVSLFISESVNLKLGFMLERLA
jgi:hypothetical protein